MKITSKSLTNHNLSGSNGKSHCIHSNRLEGVSTAVLLNMTQKLLIVILLIIKHVVSRVAFTLFPIFRCRLKIILNCTEEQTNQQLFFFKVSHYKLGL